MIDIRGGGTTAAVSQLNDNGKLTTFIPNVNCTATGPIGIPSLNAQNSDHLRRSTTCRVDHVTPWYLTCETSWELPWIGDIS